LKILLSRDVCAWISSQILEREDHMGVLDGLLGGTVGAALVGAVNDIIEKNGGLAGLAANFRQKGLSSIVDSWISTGQNQAITPEQVSQAVGPELINQLATKLGMQPDELRRKLVDVLPAAVDKLTPEGRLPA
jgi:uncharacterized protein YidB (DUF937 family)